jgi:hypothetical protein
LERIQDEHLILASSNAVRLPYIFVPVQFCTGAGAWACCSAVAQR